MIAREQRLCLNMIVRNETVNLERCLSSVAAHVSCWVIVDTGSTDGSQEFIRSFFGERGIPGELHGIPFVDFEQARNAALELAGASPLDFDYLLLMDADMELVVEDLRFRRDLEAPAYEVLQRSSVSYVNLRLVRRDVRARYRGVTHEYLEVPAGARRLTSIWFRDHASGSNRADKFERDIRLLSGALEGEPQNPRHWFYLAQSYRDAGRTAEAARTYAKRAGMGGWDEEAWYARWQEARCLLRLGDAAGFVSTALAAFDLRPHRAEPLYDLARFHRERGMNAASVLFSETGLALGRPQDDVLFIEDHVYDVGLREEYSIAAYYARDPARRDRGFAACNALALDRRVPRGPRELARANLHFYTVPAAALLPSFAARPIGFAAPAGCRAGAASVALLQGGIVVVQTAAATRAAGDGQERLDRCFLLRLSPQLKTLSAQELLPPDTPASAPLAGLRGIADCRPFVRSGDLWLCATVLEASPEGPRGQVIARVETPASGPCRLAELQALGPDGQTPTEGGWMPRAGDSRLDFISRCDPTRIVDARAQVVAESVPGVAADAFRVVTQLVPFEDGWLALVQEACRRDGRVFRRHRFARLDAASALRSVSRPFFFAGMGDEQAGGLALHPDGQRLLVTFDAGESGSWIAAVDRGEVRAALEDVDRLLSAASGADGSTRTAPTAGPMPGPESRSAMAGAPDAGTQSPVPRFRPAGLARPPRLLRSAPAVSTWVPPAPAAGTELMAAGLRLRLGGELERINLQVNRPAPDRSDARPHVVWIHHDVNQEWVQWCRDRALVETVDRFVFVSYWQRERYLEHFGLPPERCVVLRNATDVGAEPRRWEPGPVLRCAYASTPFRGLSVLLDAWQLLAPSGAELHVWSSMKLYLGDDGPYQRLYERAQSMPGVVYHGIVPNADLRAELRSLHFLAYPSTFAETSCLAVIEAMAAGCRVVVPSLGALPETTSGYGCVYAAHPDPAAHAAIFARTLAGELARPWGGTPDLALAQQRHCALTFDWRPRLEEWRALIASACLSPRRGTGA